MILNLSRLQLSLVRRQRARARLSNRESAEFRARPTRARASSQAVSRLGPTDLRQLHTGGGHKPQALAGRVAVSLGRNQFTERAKVQTSQRLAGDVQRKRKPSKRVARMAARSRSYPHRSRSKAHCEQFGASGTASRRPLGVSDRHAGKTSQSGPHHQIQLG